MMHYHGTPITKLDPHLLSLAGRNFCVSYASPVQVEMCHRLGQSVLLDNGAYTFWRQGGAPDWPGYYEWCERWLDYRTTWAVIPDVIDGGVEENDALIAEWPHGDRGAPVWHLHEPVERLLALCETWPRVCFGSSGAYAEPQSSAWRHRMEDAFNALCPNAAPPVWLHMLRAMAQACEGPYPFASADSTNVARNHARERETPAGIAQRWDELQPPARWEFREQMEFVA